MFRGFALDKAKTFRPRRNHRIGTKRYELHKYAQVGRRPRAARSRRPR